MNHDWKDFWKNYKPSTEADPQAQVFRTRNKVSISEDQWKFTLTDLFEVIKPKANDRVLDLCCGNGLISEALSPVVSTITSVDISSELIQKLKSKNIANVLPIQQDIRTVSFPKNSFDTIIIYAAVQYLSFLETLLVLKNCKEWLTPDGVLFVADIPDQSKIWKYFDSSERRKAYFSSLESGQPMIGTWFSQDEIMYMGEYCGFQSNRIRPQSPELIYSDFRFDAVLRV